MSSKIKITKYFTIGILLVSIISTTCVLLYTEVLNYINSEAEKLGVSYKGINIKLNEIHLYDVSINKDNISSNFKHALIHFDNGLNINSVIFNDGELSLNMKDHDGRTSVSKKKKIDIHINNFNVRIDHKIGSITCENSNIKINDNLLLKSESVKINNDKFSAEVKNVVLHKNESIEVSFDRSTVVTHGKEFVFVNSEIKNIKLDNNYIEFNAKIEEVNLPIDINIYKNSIHASFDGEKISFDIKSGSISGKHNMVAKNGIELNSLHYTGTMSVNNIISVSSILSINNTVLEIDGSTDLKTKDTNVRINMDWTSCQSMLESVPSEMKSRLNGLEFSGNIKSSIDVNIESQNPKVIFDLTHKCKAIKLPDDIKSALLNKSFQRMVYKSSGEMKKVTSGINQPNWVGYGHISPYMIKSVMTTEDPGFVHHNGFSRSAIQNSIRDNIKTRKFLRGASTLQMQLSKNMFLNREKTISRKIQEFFLTIIINQEMSKNEIIEMYLNIVEFGPDIYGIYEASMYYFNSHPLSLSLRQSVFLSSILPRPNRLYFNRDRSLTTGKNNHVNLILNMMRNNETITEEEFSLAMEEEISFGASLSVQKHTKWNMIDD